jgi:hypothetical protein
LIVEFSSQTQGTFPLWYDPYYWFGGEKLRFDLRRQIAVLGSTLRSYKGMVSLTLELVAGAVVLFIVGRRDAGFARFLRASWLFTWPVATFLMFALIHVEFRYVAGFWALFWLAIYGALAARVTRRAAVVVCVMVGGALMVHFMAAARTHIATDLELSKRLDYVAVADSLRNLGVRSGDRLAVVGFPFNPLYAHYAGMRLVAAIPATDDVWNMRAEEWKAVGERLTEIGVKAVVTTNRPHNSATANWHDVNVSGPERFSILLPSEMISPDGYAAAQR